MTAPAPHESDTRAHGRPAIAPAPVEEELATEYQVEVDGQVVATQRARVSAHPLNQVWPGYQRPTSQTEIASFATWDMSAPVTVTIVSSRPVRELRVRPSAAGIIPSVEGATIRFAIDTPGQYTVEVQGRQQALHLFANPPDAPAPDPADPAVRYFGPGVHCPGLMRLDSGQTVYLAGGAVVYGAILAEHAEGITIRGRGILDGSRCDRMDVTGLVCLYDCADARIDGIILRDAGGFTIVPVACRQVQIRNVKIIGNWRYNSDGIDLVNCRHCRVEDSFIRSFDDSIAIKGYHAFGPFIYALQLCDGRWDNTFLIGGEHRTFAEFQRRLGIYPCHGEPIEDIQVRRCVIWNDWGRALEIGAETVADGVRGLLFDDCDIIHAAEVAMDVQNCDRARCSEIVFRNIRVELDDGITPMQFQSSPEQVYVVPPDTGYLPHLIVLEIKPGYASFDDVRGHIEDIRFQDIAVIAPGIPPSRIDGYDADHLVQRVAIENLRLNGRPAIDLQAGGIVCNAFARQVALVEQAATDPRSVLILGNSITLHGPNADIGWTGNWGMAASERARDFAHLLLQRLAARNDGTAPAAMIENIADFERGFQECAVETAFSAQAGFAAELVILAIGENVPALETAAQQRRFRDQVAVLLAMLRRHGARRIIVRSTFWPNPVTDAMLREACQAAGGVFVDISPLSRDEANYARAERQFAHDGVAAHPGDCGMQAIADALWRAMAGETAELPES